MQQKPSIPKGTRDFGPQEMMRRNYIFDTIRYFFEKHAYRPIETPAMEHLSTLLGKYGEEGDRLLFKVLNSGDFLAGVDLSAEAKRMGLQICEKGLRYDLTVPFARFVVQHQNSLTFPFKRYQIQPVWRADRPQKGRYREFFQCDVDVIGSASLLNEVDLLCIIDSVFKKLNLAVVTKINNRKILSGISEYIGAPNRMMEITTAIDKMEKIGLNQVNEELSKILCIESLEKLQPILLMSGDFGDKISVLRNLLKVSEIGLRGISEVEELFEYISAFQFSMPCELDLTLARGLNYYTGAIFEVKSLQTKIGSLCGGGRYDDLTGIFGLKDLSGVGVSFGADRIYDVLEELQLFPEGSARSTQLLFVNFGGVAVRPLLPLLALLRQHGVCCELYPDSAKLQKQFSYANANQIPYVAVVGEEEIQTQTITLKNMHTGEQERILSSELLTTFISKNS